MQSVYKMKFAFVLYCKFLHAFTIRPFRYLNVKVYVSKPERILIHTMIYPYFYMIFSYL